MKKMYKAMLLVLCAILLVAGSVMGTLAYLQMQTGPVKNTFTAGQVGITLNEAKTNEYGVADTPEVRVTGNEYKLIPGKTYAKDPTITVAEGSEDCWVLVKLENGLNSDCTFNIDETKWTHISNGVYAYGEKLSAGDEAIFFTQFTFAEIANPATYEDAEIVITAYAIQAEGFADAVHAWGNVTFN